MLKFDLNSSLLKDRLRGNGLRIMTVTRNEHLSLICDVGDLASLVSDSKDIETFLQKVVQLVAANLNADMGSIYPLLKG